MNRLLWLTPVITALALPASAQTILSLTSSGSATTSPDEVVAQFEIQATKPTASAAQQMVNQEVAKALSTARSVQGITVTTSNYDTYSTTPDRQTKPSFTAQQTLTLVQSAADGIPGKSFSDVLAKLQSDGLLLTTLKGDLSATGQQKLQQQAVHNALLQLNEDAKTIAATLNQKVVTLKSLNVDMGGGVVPPILPRGVMMAASAPQSVPGNMSTTANISAQIELGQTP